MSKQFYFLLFVFLLAVCANAQPPVAASPANSLLDINYTEDQLFGSLKKKKGKITKYAYNIAVIKSDSYAFTLRMDMEVLTIKDKLLGMTVTTDNLIKTLSLTQTSAVNPGGQYKIKANFLKMPVLSKTSKLAANQMLSLTVENGKTKDNIVLLAIHSQISGFFSSAPKPEDVHVYINKAD
ncbi:hypothetical protein AAIR98_001393 [Elusimicrobium simillimum]|uniref:hypothetical protein n=1 Tax=Elusimicrobium simillimum TaxID=3143438 RepID=UPI003C6F2F67